MSPAKRMAKDERRRQLLETALRLVREEGTEGLTLARLAERAGVTKPIAYGHFGTKAGLLVALFLDYDDRTTQAMREALKTGGTSIENVAAIFSAAYVDCCQSMGPEISAVYDALSASDETEGFRQSWRKSLVKELSAAFAPFHKLPPRKIENVLMGVLGAAELLSEEAAAARMSRNDAINTLSRIIAGAIEQNPASRTSRR